ncbi:hypothetical protein MHYP_G00023410 [Metynnis hypsauchen]
MRKRNEKDTGGKRARGYHPPSERQSGARNDYQDNTGLLQDISKCKEDPPMQPDQKLTVNIPQIHYERREIKQFGCTEHRV